MKGGDKMKKVLAACIDQVLLFDSIQEVDSLEADLKRKHQTYAIKQIEHLENGQVKVRIKKRYNNNEFLDEGGDSYE